MSINELRRYLYTENKNKKEKENIHFYQDSDEDITIKDLLLSKYSPKVFELDCVVEYISLEGGFYGLTSGKLKLNPINLDDEFKEDKMNVRITYILGSDYVSFKMWGTIIILKTINEITNYSY